MKKIIAVVLLCLMVASCVHRFPDTDGADVRDISAQTVKISVSIAGDRLHKDENGDVVVEEGVVSGWSGTGVVVAADRSRGAGESLVMSAAHVLNIPKFMLQVNQDGELSLFVVKASLMIVEKLDGSGCEGVPMYVDVPNDVGMLKASCVAGDVATIASDLPPVGAMVTMTGAGLGIHPNGVFLAVDGRYVGFDEGFNPQEMLTIPAAPGHSGSGVFYRGQVFGIVSRGAGRYEHVTLAVPLEYMKDCMAKSLEIWNAN